MSTALPSNSWYLLDQLIDLECAARTFGKSVPGLVDQIHAQRNVVLDSPKTIDDFNSLSDAELLGPDFVQHKAAWIAQRITGYKSFCVGSKIIRSRKGSVTSPILNQLHKFDWSIDNWGLDKRVQLWSRSQLAANNTVDALTIDPNSRTVHVIKAASLSQVKYDGVGAGTLFLPDNQIISTVTVSPESVNTLLRVGEVLNGWARSWNIKLYYIVVGDDYSWSFQCHDLSRAINGKLFDKPVCLDDYPLFTSTRAYMSELRGNPDLFGMVGNPPPYNNLNQALHVCPIYRYSRAMMVLSELWGEQRHHPDRLVSIPANELQDRICLKYDFSYTVDARRHDLEDCLRAGHFIGRTRWKRNEYALDARGVARILIMMHKYNKMTPCLTEDLVDRAFKQKQLWGRDSGSSSI